MDKVLMLLKENLEKEGINVTNFVKDECVSLDLIVEQLENKTQCAGIIEKIKDICI